MQTINRWVQAEMSEDEGHSQGGSDDDADEDGDLVSRISHGQANIMSKAASLTAMRRYMHHSMFCPTSNSSDNIALVQVR